jgi:hypothetical protein
VFTPSTTSLLGEDGPSHQPIEHLAALRAIPNLIVILSCDPKRRREAVYAKPHHRCLRDPTAMIAIFSGRLLSMCKLKSEGTSLRQAKSPLPPKITNAQESVGREVFEAFIQMKRCGECEPS